MIPTNKVVGRMNGLYAIDETTWGDPSSATHIQLIQSEFVPSAELTLADVTLADFDGSTPIAVPIAPQIQVVDSGTGRLGILLKEPVGGYKFICSGATNLPQTIYGWAVTDDADSDHILWSELLPVPKVIASAGDFVELTALLGYQVINPYNSDLEA